MKENILALPHWGGPAMKCDLDRHLEKLLRDEEFRLSFEGAEAKRIIAQKIAIFRKAVTLHFDALFLSE